MTCFRFALSPLFGMKRTLAAVIVSLSLLFDIQSQVTSSEGRASPSRPLPASSLAQKIEQELFERTKAPIRQLDIDLIMLGPDFSGTVPAEVSWAGDNAKLWFRWKTPGEKETGIYRVVRTGGLPQRLSKSQEAAVPPPSADRDSSGRWALYSFEGDIYLLDTHSERLRKITNSSEGETEPRFTSDARRVVFRRGDNLYRLPLEGEASLHQLTDLRSGKDPEAEKKKREEEGQRRFLKQQQTDLFLTLRNRVDKEKEEETRKKARRPQPFYFDDRKVERLRLSPDENYVAVEFSSAPKEQIVAQVPDYVTSSGYVSELKSRAKVGDIPESKALWILDLEASDCFQVLVPGLAAAGATSEPSPARADKQGPKEPAVHVFDAVWSKEGHRLLATARSADNKKQWLLAVDAATKTVRTLHLEQDEAWVLNRSDCGFLAGDQRVWFRSEHTGFLHLYSMPWEGGPLAALTEGKFEVSNVALSRDRKTVYFNANREGPEVVHFYSLPSEGGTMQKLTAEPGHHQVTLSPDGAFLADLFSFSNRPWELWVQPSGNPRDRRVLTDSPTVAFKSYPWIEPRLIKVPARDGVGVPARLYAPAKSHPSRPAVIFVHGAGYLQNVHRWWSYYYREYMFHHFLMERGYTVLDLDYRGSSGYGRDWRTAIYRHMGGKDLSDQIDAASYLVKHHGAHPERIGIYGGSYGGFITLMALFTAPKSFGAGAALRPVTDWAHYNHPYTSNILNLPQNDEEAYRRSSPIYFAEGLEDPLLICHGLVDVNVHAQDTLRLAQRLIELRKANFEIALYPVEDHAFKEASSWADEYKRIFDLFERHLKQAGPR